MRGIIAAAGYVPYHRLDRAEIAAFFRADRGGGTRAVAAHDEDTTTLAVAAASAALASTAVRADAVWFATSTPAYLDKTNATAIHAALGLDTEVDALDFGGAIRSGLGALRAAFEGTGTTLVIGADVRDGRPGGTDEAQAGDGAAAVLVGDAASPTSSRAPSGGPLLAEYLGGAVRTVEVTERWRLPGGHSQSWEERFGESVYPPLIAETWVDALAAAGGVKTSAVDRLIVTGLNRRAVTSSVARLGVASDRVADDLAATVGNTATAHPALLLTAALEQAEPDQLIAVVGLADGVDVMVMCTTGAVTEWLPDPAATVAGQISAGGPVSYSRFLAWRKLMAVEPPNRPPPARLSAPAAYRRAGWKYGFVGSRDRSSQMVHLPPARVAEQGGAVDDMEPAPMAATAGTVITFTIDRLSWSADPPVIFAVVDFDGGGRVPVELTDIDPDEVHTGMRVEPTFRRLATADQVHNYFWKARPLPMEPAPPTAPSPIGLDLTDTNQDPTP